MLEQISIIIPVHEKEKQLDRLLFDLEPIKDKLAIIIRSEGTRAKSLNAGATAATSQFLWFLHADSRVTAKNTQALEQTLHKKPNDLHYFDLAFDKRGLASINAWGANIRSRLFGTPFGDQGFCISKKQFEKTGGYPEDVPYGEDLMFVWKARQTGIKLNRIPSKLVTSSRKYKTHGWLKLTLLYQWRWIGMSIPEMLKQK